MRKMALLDNGMVVGRVEIIPRLSAKVIVSTSLDYYTNVAI